MLLKNIKSSKAFSLIEILLVLSILAFIFAFVAQRFTREKPKIKTFFDRFVRLNRRLVRSSKFHNKTYRLVIQLEEDGRDQYWVEKQNPSQAVDLTNQEEEEESQSDFTIDDSFYSEPKPILSFLDITKVESFAWAEDQTQGLVYIYYYPKGLAQETAIQFSRRDRSGSWTLYLDPVTKNLQILKKIKNLAKDRGIK